MSELSTQAFPNGGGGFPQSGGWVFRQPQTGWQNPYPLVGFKASVDAIIKHRMSNKAVTAKHRLSTDRGAVEQELIVFNRARLGIPDPAKPSFFQIASSRLPSRVVAAAADIRKAAQGTAVVLDWITSGGAPVAQELAEKRAAICVQCPKNVPGSWYTVAPAELIRDTLSARSDLKLATRSDDKLESCDVCKCLMRLKVWTPLEFILNKTKPEILKEFPGNCWIANRDM